MSLKIQKSEIKGDTKSLPARLIILLEKSGDTFGCIFRCQHKDYGCRQRNKPRSIPNLDTQIFQLASIGQSVGLTEDEVLSVAGFINGISIEFGEMLKLVRLDHKLRGAFSVRLAFIQAHAPRISVRNFKPLNDDDWRNGVPGASQNLGNLSRPRPFVLYGRNAAGAIQTGCFALLSPFLDAEPCSMSISITAALWPRATAWQKPLTTDGLEQAAERRRRGSRQS